MPTFDYRGRAEDGALRRGAVEAASMEDAAEIVLARGITPVDLQSRGGESIADMDVGELFDRYFPRSVPLEDLVTFTRQLHALLRAGVPIIRALRGLADNATNKTLGRAVRDVANGLERGGSLTEGVSQYPNAFSPLMVAMIQVGEESGRLEDALVRLGDYLERERVTRQQIRQALRYPTIVMVAIAAVIVIVNLFVIPAFAGLFQRFDADLPGPTLFLMALSDFFVAYWPHMLGGLVGVALALRLLITRTERGRLTWDYVKLFIPASVGRILHRALLARFARTFAMSLRSGVPLLRAMDSVADAINNRYVGRGVRTFRDGIERGEGIYQVAERSGLFTPLVLQMLSVGEETGQIADMMDQVADFYEREVELGLEKLSTYIEPIVITIIAAFVLVLALGIFLPIWQMGSAAM